MKKTIGIVLALVLCFSFAACGTDTAASSASSVASLSDRAVKSETDAGDTQSSSIATGGEVQIISFDTHDFDFNGYLTHMSDPFNYSLAETKIEQEVDVRGYNLYSIHVGDTIKTTIGYGEKGGTFKYLIVTIYTDSVEAADHLQKSRAVTAVVYGIKDSVDFEDKESLKVFEDDAKAIIESGEEGKTSLLIEDYLFEYETSINSGDRTMIFSVEYQGI